ncbi:hypothetical protein Tco_0273177 [Tanacetum coccineum]
MTYMGTNSSHSSGPESTVCARHKSKKGKENSGHVGKMDFARVLVEVSVDDDLPSSLEISYQPLLDVIYQWKPTLYFTSEYGIPEGLHLEFPGPEEMIVEFPEGKVDMDLFNLIIAPNPTKVKTRTCPCTAYEVLLLTVTASYLIDMEDVAVASESSGTPSTIEKSPLDFANEDPPQTITERGKTEDQVQDEVAYEIPLTEIASTTRVAVETDLEEEVAAMGCHTPKSHCIGRLNLG